ncbi:hypothetical protein Q5H92_25175 [Hymenobacter sp. M29]|uniref:Uncharacterized protein n=1 Tax=Hymenobacter mellowenesis TaxID=3063995 RepID=A0ABT9AKC3_9BACT|nr:hypothetical protein [Hymenobacter sp. M29]MDO7849680.1 hypothetical protein [Hymenobacter sp. M29]
MKIALELEFPDEQAAAFMQRLQSLPGLTARFLRLRPEPQVSPIAAEATDELTEAEQKALLYKVFGSWQSDVSGDEMVRQIYADRRDEPREVNL